LYFHTGEEISWTGPGHKPVAEPVAGHPCRKTKEDILILHACFGKFFLSSGK
jgi:hypothetical protein